MPRVTSEFVTPVRKDDEANQSRMIGLAEINGHVFGLSPIIQDEVTTSQEFAIIDSESGSQVIDPQFVRIGTRYIHSIGQIGTTDVIREDPSRANNLTSLIREFLVKQSLIRLPAKAIVITLHKIDKSKAVCPKTYGGSHSGYLIPASIAWTIRINVHTPTEELAKLGIPKILEKDQRNGNLATEINSPKLSAYLFALE